MGVVSSLLRMIPPPHPRGTLTVDGGRLSVENRNVSLLGYFRVRNLLGKKGYPTID